MHTIKWTKNKNINNNNSNNNNNQNKNNNGPVYHIALHSYIYALKLFHLSFSLPEPIFFHCSLYVAYIAMFVYNLIFIFLNQANWTYVYRSVIVILVVIVFVLGFYSVIWEPTARVLTLRSSVLRIIRIIFQQLNADPAQQYRDWREAGQLMPS